MNHRPLFRQARSLFGSLADFVFPPFCAACHGPMPGRERGAVCSACWSAYPRWQADACQRCGMPVPVSNEVRLCAQCVIPGWGCAAIRALGPFAAPVSEAVHLLKYSDRRSVAKKLGGMMAEAVKDDPAYWQADLILAVPLHPARQRERGYNQAQLLAEQVGNIMSKPAPDKVLVRMKNTGSQTAMNRQERKKNVEDIFRVKRPDTVRGKSVILVDDVLTTGATIGSCGQSLLRADAKSVLALTAAAAPLA
ncbi:MAG: ComF family protein [Candidatus Edwardsbacteria bacterium]|nr:ComF family protein [Candidatus Edwardsbacteria bacterium]